MTGVPLFFDLILSQIASAKLKTCTSSKLPKLAFLLIPEKRKVAEALPGACQTSTRWKRWICGEVEYGTKKWPLKTFLFLLLKIES